MTRIQHNGETTLATADSRLALDDIVAVVGHQAALERAHHLFGDPAKVQIERDRNVLDYRRVFVSSRDCVGKRIGDLNLRTANTRAPSPGSSRSAPTSPSADRLGFVSGRCRNPRRVRFRGNSSHERCRDDSRRRSDHRRRGAGELVRRTPAAEAAVRIGVGFDLRDPHGACQPGFCQPHIPFRRPTIFVRASFPGVHRGQDCPCASCWWRGDRRAKG